MFLHGDDVQCDKCDNDEANIKQHRLSPYNITSQVFHKTLIVVRNTEAKSSDGNTDAIRYDTKVQWRKQNLQNVSAILFITDMILYFAQKLGLSIQ